MYYTDLSRVLDSDPVVKQPEVVNNVKTVSKGEI